MPSSAGGPDEGADVGDRRVDLRGVGLEVEAYLYGALIRTPHDGDVIATALNERFADLGGDPPIPYSDDQ